MTDVSIFMAFAAGLISFLSLYLFSGIGGSVFLTAIGIERFWGFFSRFKKYLRLLEITTGVIMIILGVLIYTNKLILIPGYLTFLNKFAL